MSTAKRDCCVSNCETAKNGCFTFYSMPSKDEMLCSAWTNRIGNLRKSNLSLKSPEICEKHFHYMCKTGLNSQLHENSLPTLSLPNFNDDPTRENCFLHRQEESDIFDERNLKFNLKIEDFENICRICYSNGILYNLKESKFKNESTMKLVQKILPEEIFSDNNLPQNICLNCLKALLIANSLIDQLISSNSIYSQLLDPEISEKHLQLSYPNLTDLKSALFDCQLQKYVEITNNNSRKRKVSLKTRNFVIKPNSNEEIKVETCQMPRITSVKDIPDFINLEIISKSLKNELDNIEISPEIEKDIKSEEVIIDTDSDDHNSTAEEFFDDNSVVSIEPFDNKRRKYRKKYHCDKCSLDFVGYRLFSRHNKATHPKSYFCNICNKDIGNSHKLSLHRWTHLQMECNICHKKVQKTWLKGHMKTHEEDYKPKPFKKVEKLCPLCGKMLSRSVYRDHMAGHTGPKRYKCKLCSFASTFSANLKRHQALHTGAKPYLCTNCGYSCNQKVQLEVHAKQHIVSETPLTCAFCPETFRTRYDRRLHSVRHSNGTTATTICTKSVNSVSEKTAYNAFDKKYYNDTEGQYVCPSCPTMCENRVALVRHLRNEHGDFEVGCLPCGFCDKKFSCRSSLGLHIRSQHDTVSRFVCDICEKAFKAKPSLKEHILIHTGERPHKCDLCPSAFRQHQHLTSHKLRMHDDRKPFPCDFCDKAFKCTFSLKEHVRIHTGETINCEHCEKTFKQSSNKYKHMREVHNIRRSALKTK